MAIKPDSTRSTRQAEAVRHIFQTARRPLSAREAHEMAGEHLPGIGIATVYRAIRRLLESGTLATVDIPGVGAHYEVTGEGHHHYFYCGDCGRVYVIEGCPGRMSALLPEGFEMRRHDIVLHGRCAACNGVV